MPSETLYLVTEDYGDWTPVAIYESIDEAKKLAPDSDQWETDRGVTRNPSPNREATQMLDKGDTVHYVMQGICTAAIVAAVDDESTAELWAFHSQSVGQGQGFSYHRAAPADPTRATEGSWHARGHSAE